MQEGPTPRSKYSDLAASLFPARKLVFIRKEGNKVIIITRYHCHSAPSAAIDDYAKTGNRNDYQKLVSRLGA